MSKYLIKKHVISERNLMLSESLLKKEPLNIRFTNIYI